MWALQRWGWLLASQLGMQLALQRWGSLSTSQLRMQLALQRWGSLLASQSGLLWALQRWGWQLEKPLCLSLALQQWGRRLETPEAAAGGGTAAVAESEGGTWMSSRLGLGWNGVFVGVSDGDGPCGGSRVGSVELVAEGTAGGMEADGTAVCDCGDAVGCAAGVGWAMGSGDGVGWLGTRRCGRLLCWPLRRRRIRAARARLLCQRHCSGACW